MALYPKTALSLFSGYGGLDLGLEMATGCRTVCYVEREAFAASILVARMEEAALGQAPVWDDVTTFDGGPWRGVVDCVVGGSPCQDLSVAGKRAGLDGARSGLWRQMRRIVGQAGPAFVFWENVGGAINAALDLVSEDLEGLGYRTAGCVVEASDVGTPHERRRLFVLAHAECDGRFWNGRGRPGKENGGRSFGKTQGPGSGVVYTNGQRRRRLRPEGGGQAGGARALGETGRPGLLVADANGGAIRKEQISELGRGEQAIAQLNIGALADTNAEGQRQPQGRFKDFGRWPPDRSTPVERWWGAEPAIRRGANGPADKLDESIRADRLRALGNGVVPQQAAVAFLVCWKRMFG